MFDAVSSTSLWLFVLGAVHGLNPGMGWLFAVALGLQERSARAVWRALLPLAAGHALAIAIAVLLAAVLGFVIPIGALKWLVAAALMSVAVFRVLRGRHVHWGGMRMGTRDLAIWSLLMASAHGAGLMVLPLLLQGQDSGVPVVRASTITPPSESSAADHQHHHGAMATDTRATTGHAAHLAGLAASGSATPVSGLAATAVHSLGYLLMTGLIAVVVYSWAGLRLLRAAWINLDLIWGGALIVTAALTPLL